MVKCSQIINEVISTVMGKFDQPMKVKTRYEKLFENLLNGSSLDSDVISLIEELKLNESIVGRDIIKLIESSPSIILGDE